MLQIRDMTYRIGGRVLFKEANATIAQGHRVGLVGRNGAGKSTLLKLIGGVLSPDEGDIRLRRRASLGMLAQEAPDGPRSLLEAVLDADLERARLMRAADTEADPHKLAEIHIRLADIGAHAAPARAAAILAGLGFDETAQARPLSSFSGGWRMRVALASILFQAPDLLLLDEPTNYLDLEGALWLENFLRAYRGTILIVSHDRDLLNSAVTGILHLQDGKLAFYPGGYDRFERSLRERLEHSAKARKRQQRERDHLQSFVDRFRAKATKARQAQSRLKMLERMKPIASVVTQATPHLVFPAPGALPPPIIDLEDAAAGYAPGAPVLRGLNLRLDPDDRIALLGANGNGKSTFAKLLAGRLEPMGGAVRQAKKLRIGYFAQHQLDELTAGDSLFAHLSRAMPDASPTAVRAHLGAFGFTKDAADRDVAVLSGGEKARGLFALISRHKPHLLILDEPTNHLDIDMREELARALGDYDGAVVLISHDRHLIDACADRLWLVAGGTVSAYDGDMDDYRQLILKGDTQAPSPDKKPSKREARRAGAQARARLSALRKAVSEAEKRIETLTAKRERLERELADPALYEPAGMAQLEKLTRQRAAVGKDLETAESDWLAATEQLEEASQPCP